MKDSQKNTIAREGITTPDAIMDAFRSHDMSQKPSQRDRAKAILDSLPVDVGIVLASDMQAEDDRLGLLPCWKGQTPDELPGLSRNRNQ